MRRELRAVQLFRRALLRGCAHGLSSDGNEALVLTGPGPGDYFTRTFDTGEEQSTFHRLTVEGAFEGLRLEVIAAASDTTDGAADNMPVSLPRLLADPDAAPERKRRALRALAHVRAVNSPDILLHALRGRYLWIAVRIAPESAAAPGRCAGRLDGLRFEFPKVVFTQYFPEVYQGDDFFDRFISIFQSVYLDLERRAGALPMLLDYESAPDGLVGELADWLGLVNPGGLLSPAQMRRMIAQLALFQGARGTRRALEGLIELATGEKPRVVEHFCWDFPDLTAEKRALCARLYGESFDSLCILLDVSRRTQPLPLTAPELERLAEAYCPLGASCRAVLLRRCSRADTYCYLDVNSALSEPQAARADGALLGGHIAAG